VAIRRFDWEISYTAAITFRLLDTFSGHIAMKSWQRDRCTGRSAPTGTRPDDLVRRPLGRRPERGASMGAACLRAGNFKAQPSAGHRAVHACYRRWAPSRPSAGLQFRPIPCVRCRLSPVHDDLDSRRVAQGRQARPWRVQCARIGRHVRPSPSRKNAPHRRRAHFAVSHHDMLGCPSFGSSRVSGKKFCAVVGSDGWPFVEPSERVPRPVPRGMRTRVSTSC